VSRRNRANSDEGSKVARILLLTGAPGVGKTTLMRRLIAALEKRRIGGFTTQEMRGGGQRVGFRIVPQRGSERIMAHVDRHGSPRVGRYGVDVHAIFTVGAYRWLHRQIGQHLEKMILDDVADGADLVVEGTAALDAEAFRHGDLHTLHLMASVGNE
jgi:nucleoside-triphosphatase THEP1